ncbi:MAG: EAL domain-containing protein [Candidatus Palauibacterales bacterium]|nr:EAL domain-containing protein [Candidatus Palauibacterales bacterium]
MTSRPQGHDGPDAIGEPERFLDTIAGNLPGILYRCRNTRTWTMEYLSPGTEELTGYRPEELLHDEEVAYGDLIHPDDREDVWGEVQDALDDGRPYQLQYRIRTRDGGVRWVWEQGRGVHPDSGERLYLEGFIFDITAWRRAREESEMATSLLSATVRNIPDAVFVVKHPERRLVFCNPAAEQLFGYSREELLGMDTELLHLDRESYERFGRVSQAALAEEGVFRGEFRMRRADGTTFPTEHVVSYVLGDDGPEYAVSVIRDVTGWKDVERSLRKSRTKFATAFQVNPMAMAITGLGDGRFLEVNRGFEEITGYDRNEILGRTSLEIEFWDDPRDRREVLSRIEAQGAVRNYETRLRMKDGEVRDALYSGQKFELDGRPCLLSAAQDITQRKRFEEELEHQALHDGLTGLPNRTLLRDRLEQALSRAERSDGEVAVVFLDLDRFKVVNDTLGHPAGDELLRTVGTRLGDATRGQDTVARYGGDEFAVLFEGIAGEDELRVVTGRVRSIFDAPVTVAGTEIHPSASIGVAVSGPECRDPDDLIRYADIAMYRIKAPDSTAIHVYDPAADDGVTNQLHQENELRRAVREGEFVLHYQPVLNLETRSVVGAEALVRWEHPEAGLVAPGEFIPLAEETGLIVPIGEFVLDRAARTAVGWMDRHDPGGSRFRVSVNLSARQHREEELPARIRAFADDADLPLDRLTLEITESVLMSGRSKLQELRAAGLKLAIDDFGTGYSSLQYLRSLEADVLKIDRGFVADVESPGRESVIVQAILMMARQFGMEVVAEGVETETQARHLENLGCGYAQGFHFARPMPAEKFEEEWLAG